MSKFSIFVHPDAESDLEGIFTDEPSTADRIVVLLDELEGSQNLLDRLSQAGYGSQSLGFNVDCWKEQAYHKNRNLWRLKVWDEYVLLGYRIIYAFIPLKNVYHVLGIVKRDFNYDAQHEISKRIFRAYEDLSG